VNGVAEIDYEAVVRDLHARIGTRVLVSIGEIDGYGAGSVMGVLNSANEADYARLLPDLLPDMGGESLIFIVGEPAVTAGGTFVLWRPGFQWGRVWQSVLGPSVSFAVRNIAVRVMPAPPPLTP
jgi:hypothetical protein